LAQTEFAKRQDGVTAINVAIGNVCLPMYPAMHERLKSLGGEASPFAQGVVGYSETVGREETRAAFTKILEASGLPTANTYVQVTDGGSQAMELAILGVTGQMLADGVSSNATQIADRPLLVIDATYANYAAFAKRLGRRTVSIHRSLNQDGTFSLPDLEVISETIHEHQPSALLVIPYDNPTGQLYTHQQLVQLARLCVANNMWLISDEAYRELHYGEEGQRSVSIWSLTEAEVPGITGRRVSLETVSKVWNGCGLRIGALISDNQQFWQQSVAENTSNLCSNVIGQYIVGALAHEKIDDMRAWFDQQRQHYKGLMTDFYEQMQIELPAAIVSQPQAAIYSVVDVRNMVPSTFSAEDFVLFCAQQGSVQIEQPDGTFKAMTLLAAPMSGFYQPQPGQPNPGKTQLRIAFVLDGQRMAYVPVLLKNLLRVFCE
jgi:aspartate aminotransferase